ncbi:MAG: hypothetical protein ABR548_05685, partial [Actinomycetota bacterium]
MTRRRWGWRAAVALFGVATLIAPLSGAATSELRPNMLVFSDAVYVNHASGLTIGVSQPDSSPAIRSYEVMIPLGWRLALGSIDDALVTSCSQAVPDNRTTMEYVGTATMLLKTDATKMQSFGSSRAPAPAKYSGGMWFLSWDSANRVAVICADVRTSNSQIPTANREVMIQIALHVTGGGSIDMSYNLDAVPGSASGTRSVTDNDALLAQHVVVSETRFKFSPTTGGNYNTDPNGAKSKVTFAQTPRAVGAYTFVGTFSECTIPGTCPTNPVLREQVVQITSLPASNHPLPTFTTAPFRVFRGSAGATIVWQQPSASEVVAGYAVEVSMPYVAHAIHTELVAACTSCSLTLDFPLANAETSRPD